MIDLKITQIALNPNRLIAQREKRRNIANLLKKHHKKTITKVYECRLWMI